MYAKFRSTNLENDAEWMEDEGSVGRLKCVDLFFISRKFVLKLPLDNLWTFKGWIIKKNRFHVTGVPRKKVGLGLYIVARPWPVLYFGFLFFPPYSKMSFTFDGKQRMSLTSAYI